IGDTGGRGSRNPLRSPHPKKLPESLCLHTLPISRIPLRHSRQNPDKAADSGRPKAQAANREENPAPAKAFPPPPKKLRARASACRTRPRGGFRQPTRTQSKRQSRHHRRSQHRTFSQGYPSRSAANQQAPVSHPIRSDALKTSASSTGAL